MGGHTSVPGTWNHELTKEAKAARKEREVTESRTCERRNLGKSSCSYSNEAAVSSTCFITGDSCSLI